MSKRTHTCNFCGKVFETASGLDEHDDRRHPKEDVHWWVVERPNPDLPFRR